jgi:hypothetical protein
VRTSDIPQPAGERAGLPEAMLLDGPPEGADLMLQRVLRRIRAEASRRAGRSASRS